MLVYPEFDPVAFRLGPLSVHWYGLMYLFGFVAGWGLLHGKRQSGGVAFTADQIADLVFYAALGVILGGRIGYVFFYAWPELIARPWMLIEVWKGGMSFHGGLLGVMFALYLFARKFKVPFLLLTDFIAPVVPLGLGMGRMGNFINGELWGRVTTMPWGMVFPGAGPLPRHPSQLYEAFLEGVVLFVILIIYSRKPRALGAVSGLFAMTYGSLRFLVEFVREPDVQIGYLAWGLTEGQWLSLPLICLGLYLFFCAKPEKGASHETIS